MKFVKSGLVAVLALALFACNETQKQSPTAQKGSTPTVAKSTDPAKTVQPTKAVDPTKVTVKIPSIDEQEVESNIKGDYQQMLTVLTFTPDQAAIFKAKLKARNEKNDAWKSSPAGQNYVEIAKQYKDAQDGSDAAKAKELEPKYLPAKKEYDKMREDARREFMAGGVMTVDQQKKWGGYNLCSALMERLSKCELTNAQAKAVQAECDKVAAGAVNADTYKADPYLLLKGCVEPTLKTVVDSVLKAEQKDKVAPAKK